MFVKFFRAKFAGQKWHPNVDDFWMPLQSPILPNLPFLPNSSTSWDPSRHVDTCIFSLKFNPLAKFRQNLHFRQLFGTLLGRLRHLLKMSTALAKFHQTYQFCLKFAQISPNLSEKFVKSANFATACISGHTIAQEC